MQAFRFLARAASGCATLLAAMGAHAQPDAVYTHDATTLRFPRQLAEYRHVRTVTFPDTKLGTCVLYVGPGQLQLCVYTGGHRTIPTGIDSPAVKDALDAAATGTLRLTNTAPLSDGRFVLGVDPKVERDGKVAAAKGRVFESVLKRPDASSIEFSHAIALTAYRDHLLKLSISRPRVPVDAFVNQTMGLAAEFLKFNPDAIDAFFVLPAAALPK